MGPAPAPIPSASANGVVAFVVGSGTAAEIWTMAADGSGARAVTSNAARDAMPAISSDGTRIAFVTDRNGGGGGDDLWTMAADGSGAAPLFGAPGDEQHPQYSPDQRYVVLATRVGADLDLAYVPATGGPHGSATSITHHALDETAPALQPDLVRLAYTRAGDIFSAYYDGTDEFPLAVDPSRAEGSPAFSPDGTEVAYATDAGLVVAAAGGLGPQPVPTPGAPAPADLDWAVGSAPDRTPPQTTITNAPRKRDDRTRARFRFRSSEPGSSFRCRLDRRAPEDCRSPKTYMRLAAQRHRFRVLAIDPAGNADPSPATDRFRIVAAR